MMPSTHDQKVTTRHMGQEDLVRIQREMEARRVAMLKLMQDSEAKHKSLLRAARPANKSPVF